MQIQHQFFTYSLGIIHRNYTESTILPLQLKRSLPLEKLDEEDSHT